MSAEHSSESGPPAGLPKPNRSQNRPFGEFPEGWAVLRRGSPVAHWFQQSAQGRIVSLCRMLRDNPRHADRTRTDRKCHVCIDVMARSGTFNPVLARRSVELEEMEMLRFLKVRLAHEISEFTNDLQRGPRLYVCPTCRQAFEGRTDQPHFCEGTGDKPHHPAKVLELYRKDGPPPTGTTR